MNKIYLLIIILLLGCSNNQQKVLFGKWTRVNDLGTIGLESSIMNLSLNKVEISSTLKDKKENIISKNPSQIYPCTHGKDHFIMVVKENKVLFKIKELNSNLLVVEYIEKDGSTKILKYNRQKK
jgi:hypothetical protein